MQGIDYVIRQAVAFRKPVALNLSFGNNYGSHSGESLIENYIDSVSNLGRNVISVGMGNEGNAALHTSGQLTEGEPYGIALNVDAYEVSLNVRLLETICRRNGDSADSSKWADGRAFPGNFRTSKVFFWLYRNIVYYGEPAPFSLSQEIYIEFIPKNQYVDSGTWKIHLIPRKIVDGRYDLWLPGGGVLNLETKFLYPTPETTLTIPSTARNVISVGAYDSRYLAYADFSGREVIPE